MIALITTIIQLVLGIFGYAMAEKKKKEAANEAFLINEDRLRAWAESAFLDMRAKAVKDSQAAKPMWDRQDADKDKQG